MKCVIGSTSKRKIDITEKIIRQFFKDEPIAVTGYNAASLVPETPYDKETFDGSRNRALDAKNHSTNIDISVGLESGLIERYGHMFEEAWCTLLINNKEYYGYSSGLKVPDFVIEKMKTHTIPHSTAMAMIEEEYTKTPSDTWGTYSGGIIAREVSLEEALRNAVIQVLTSKESLYTK
jgi:non-canonical (house-cleaning) NTP pyrophosphatase